MEFTITTDSSGYAQNPIIINGGDYYNYGDEIIIYESEHSLGGDINGYGAPTEIRLIVTSTTSAAWKIDNGPIEFWNPSTSNATQYNFNSINNVIIENNDINGNNIENLVIYKDIYDSYETFFSGTLYHKSLEGEPSYIYSTTSITMANNVPVPISINSDDTDNEMINILHICFPPSLLLKLILD